MNKIGAFVYGVVCYAIFFLTFLYAVGFLGNLWVPKGIDDGVVGSLGMAVGINVALLSLFALQHSIMARPAFKAAWTKLVAEPIERSTYVLFSSLALILLYWQWQPMPSIIWQVDAGIATVILQGLLFTGFLIVLYASFLIDHFDLFGLRQVYLYLRGVEYKHHPFATPGLYKLIRHPLYLGWLLAFWCTPTMTYGHALFAGVSTAYIFVAIIFEERDLVGLLGADYQSYRERVPMFIPWPRKRPADSTQATPESS